MVQLPVPFELCLESEPAWTLAALKWHIALFPCKDVIAPQTPFPETLEFLQHHPAGVANSARAIPRGG